MPSDNERLVSSLVDPGSIAADLVQLVAFESEGGSDAEVDVQAWTAQRLRQLGLLVDHWPIDINTLAGESTYPGHEVSRRHAWGCVGVSPHDGEAGQPALILNGHVDVAPVGPLELWGDRNPWELETYDGRWWGRGSVDMKGGVAAIIGAAEAIRRSGIRLKRPFAVHSVIGEEDGGLGTYATLRRGHSGEACVIAEPTANDIVAACAGALTFHMSVTGRSSHAALPGVGISALDKFSVVTEALRKFEELRNADIHPLFAHLDRPWPITIGAVRSGDWASTVPDWLLAEGRYGVMPGETLREAKSLFRLAIRELFTQDEWLRDNPPNVRWYGGHFASTQFPAGHWLLDELHQAIVDVYAPKPTAKGAPYGSDQRLYHAWGIPTLLYGPGSIEQAHSTNEWVEIKSVIEAAQAYALLILRLCT